jgi:hypothetical protein
MTRVRFATLLDTYGSRLDRWPDDDRAGARLLLEGSAEARALLADAEGLVALLDQAAVPVPSAALTGRILAAAPRLADVDRVVPRRRRPAMLAAAAGMAMAASLLLWLGRAPAPRTPLDVEAVALLGVLDVPTDALLSDAGLDLDDDTPAFGCDDPTHGCDQREPAERSGRLSRTKEMPA